jgi:hypothetical protein
MVEPCVPGGGQVLPSVGLVDVHFHAVNAQRAACIRALAITIVIIGLIGVVRADGVKIVVHAPLRSRILNIELHIPAQQIVGSVAVDAT